MAEWLSTKDAAEKLHVTARSLREIRRNGYLKEGVHFRTKGTPDKVKPHLQFNVEQMEALLAKPKAKWKNCA